MAPKPTPLVDRVNRRTTRDGYHLIWNGQMKKGRPYLARVGHPARVLLGLTDHPDYQIRKVPECGHPRCIDPFHYKVIRERRFKYDDLQNTPWRDPRNPDTAQFTDRELEEIELEVENQTPIEELGVYPTHVRDEIVRRLGWS